MTPGNTLKVVCNDPVAHIDLSVYINQVDNVTLTKKYTLGNNKFIFFPDAEIIKIKNLDDEKK